MIFFIDIDRDWIDVLDSVADQTLNSSASTAEEAMEAIIFFQIKLQLIKKAGKQFVKREEPQPSMGCS